MSDMAVRARSTTTRSWIWFMVALGALLLIVVNAHLIYVAVSSQPDCVAHARPASVVGQGDAPQRPVRLTGQVLL